MGGGAAKPPQYSPPAGTASGLPGAAYPVLGSAPISNMGPRYGSAGMAQMRPGMAPPIQQGAPPLQSGMNAPQANPQQLAAALAQRG